MTAPRLKDNRLLAPVGAVLLCLFSITVFVVAVMVMNPDSFASPALGVPAILLAIFSFSWLIVMLLDL